VRASIQHSAFSLTTGLPETWIYTQETMSCDYGFWHSETSLTNEESAKIYIGLCEQWPFLEGENRAVRAFYDELTRRWPELGTVPHEKIDDKDYCPWSCEFRTPEWQL
jgi:fido (protein-threonine AMPylation protein)